MLLNIASNFIKEKRANGENIKIPHYHNDSNNYDFSKPAEIPEERNAEIIERKEEGLISINVDIKANESNFAYFLDGIERKRVIFNYRSIPVTYGYVAAVILKRTDKKMHSIEMEEISEKIYLPYKENGDEPQHYFNEEDIEYFKKYGFKPFNTGTKSEKADNYPQFPQEFEKKAHSDIQEARGKLERRLASQWLNQNHNDGWLFIDGRLENKNKELMNCAKIAGIIKSHHVHYFNFETQYKIYNLEKGQRTNVFQPEDKNGKKEDVFSWYLRLHHDKHRGVNDFGLIRVEIPAREELSSQADLISSWILLETNPVAFPASRWDRMIYPIKYCEDYLKSKAPSWAKIESLS